MTGAPGSGKSHYIRSQWQRGDLIIDLDRLVPAITLDTYTNEPKHVLKLAWALRDAAIKHAQRSASYARLWITETAPTRQRRDYLRTTLSAKVIVMRAPQDTCIKRAHSQQDRKHGNWSAVIADWFAKYQHSPDDVLIDSSEI